MMRTSASKLGSSIFRPSMRFPVLHSMLLKQCTSNFTFGANNSIRNFSSSVLESNDDTLVSILVHHEDKYDGVIVDVKQLPEDVDNFVDQLTNSLSFWKNNGKRGVWLKIPIDKVNFVEPAVKLGFVFHHAEKDFLMLSNWLCTKTENRLPGSATHQVGVGCVVLNRNNDILVVQERTGVLRGMGVWKMPTGLADEGEDISAAAEREVFEETGVKAHFRSVLCFRQSHQISFNKSDLFVVCIMSLEDENNTTIKSQQSELVDCQWLKPEAYFGQTFFKKGTIHYKINKLIKQVITDCNKAAVISSASGDDTNTSTNASSDSTTTTTNSIKTVVKLPAMVMSRHTNGVRPGLQSLYFIDAHAAEVEEEEKVKEGQDSVDGNVVMQLYN